MEQKILGIKFSENDKEMLQAVKTNFPDCQVIRSDEFEGNEIFWVAIIPLAGLTIQILDFILTYLIPSKAKAENGDSNKDTDTPKRELLSDGESVDTTDLEGKTRGEMIHTLSIKLDIKLDIEMKEEQK